jgi:hypothetical protein
LQVAGCRLLIAQPFTAVQECDARDDEVSAAVRLIKKFLIIKNSSLSFALNYTGIIFCALTLDLKNTH